MSKADDPQDSPPVDNMLFILYTCSGQNLTLAGWCYISKHSKTSAISETLQSCSSPRGRFHLGSSDVLGHYRASHSKISAPHKTDDNKSSMFSAIRWQRQQIMPYLRLRRRQWQ